MRLRLRKLRLKLNKIVLFVLVCALITLQVGARPMRTDHILQHQQIFTHSVAQLIEYIYSKGYKCTLGEVYRTRAQAALYAASGKGIVNSNHCSRLAVDISLFSPTDEYLRDVKDYKQFGEYWEKLNPFNEWGGRWRLGDACHFEMD